MNRENFLKIFGIDRTSLDQKNIIHIKMYFIKVWSRLFLPVLVDDIFVVIVENKLNPPKKT